MIYNRRKRKKMEMKYYGYKRGMILFIILSVLAGSILSNRFVYAKDLQKVQQCARRQEEIMVPVILSKEVIQKTRKEIEEQEFQRETEKKVIQDSIPARLQQIEEKLQNQYITYTQRFEIQEQFNNLYEDYKEYEITSMHKETNALKVKFFNQLAALDGISEKELKYRIYPNANLSGKSNLTKQEYFELINRLGKFDKVGFFQEYKEAFWNISEEETTDIILLTAIYAGESEWGLHSIYNNYTGQTKSNSELMRFNTVEEGIRYTAKNLAENYLRENGKFHNGYTLESIAKCFNTVDPKWVFKIRSCMKRITGLQS